MKAIQEGSIDRLERSRCLIKGSLGLLLKRKLSDLAIVSVVQRTPSTWKNPEPGQAQVSLELFGFARGWC